MPKRLRSDPIFIASEIIGKINTDGSTEVCDLRTDRVLDPYNEFDKIIIYERQVSDWFLIPATNLSRYKNKNKGFIVLMICISYLEGVEQYRQGHSSHGRSRIFFVSALDRIYPNEYEHRQLRSLYSDARCGLFHSGMIKKRIIINNKYRRSIEFVNDDIKISPSKLLADIKIDFRNYIVELQNDYQLRSNFNNMFTNIWQ